MLESKIKGKRKTISDPIKRINIESPMCAAEIVRTLARALGFEIHESPKGISAYGGNSIRIADHCTYMQTWVDNGTWNAPCRIDIVIEDRQTYPVTQVKQGFDFTIDEFVYDINDVDPQMVRLIAYDIRNAINTKHYANNVRGRYSKITSTHSPQNQSVTESRNHRRTIRLTESKLRNIIKESVMREMGMLSESQKSRSLNHTLQQIINGEEPKNVFYRVRDFGEYRLVNLSFKYNLINKEGQPLFNTWFDDCDVFWDGYARVVLDRKYNLLNKEGQFVSDTWFDDMGEPEKDGYRVVVLNDKCNLMNNEGQFMLDTWFHWIGYKESDGCRIVMMYNDHNLINQEGQLMLDTWVYYISKVWPDGKRHVDIEEFKDYEQDLPYYTQVSDLA